MKIITLIGLLVLIVGCARHPASEARLMTWAQPLEVAGVENVYRVSPELYRSEQPTRIGMENLEKLGVETVVSLRAFHSDRDLIEGTELEYERIRFETWAPDDEELVRFLKIATDPSRTPVLVHCLHGSDRTGAMCALYRIILQGWTKDAAIVEMKSGGYGHHKIWGNLERWIRGLDVKALGAALRM